MVSRLAAASGAVAAGSVPRAGTPAATIVSSPMFHVSGMIAVLITSASFPISLVFPRPGPWEPLTWLELTQRHKVTSWSGVPTQLRRLLRHPDVGSYDLSSVTTVGCGGAVFAPELVRELHARFPRVRLGNGYGMSETVGLGTLTGGEAFIARPESVGPAQATVGIQVRDDHGTVLPEGEVEEICLRTPSVFLGYWDDPAATAAALDGDRWYRTGDFGRVGGGLLYLESRRRDMIVRGGENVYPVEIENRLVEHPDIDDAAVIGVDHLELGQEPKAFAVRRPGSGPSAGQVRDWCAAALAGFKVPVTVEFRYSLPYTRTGKLLKQELEREQRSRAQAPRAPLGRVRADDPHQRAQPGHQLTVIADPVQRGLDPAGHLIDPALHLIGAGPGQCAVGLLRVLEPAEVGGQQGARVHDRVGQRRLGVAQVVGGLARIRPQLLQRLPDPVELAPDRHDVLPGVRALLGQGPDALADVGQVGGGGPERGRQAEGCGDVITRRVPGVGGDRGGGERRAEVPPEGQPEHPPRDPPRLGIVGGPDGDAPLAGGGHLRGDAARREVEVPRHAHQRDEPRQRDDDRADGRQRGRRHPDHVGPPGDQQHRQRADQQEEPPKDHPARVPVHARHRGPRGPRPASGAVLNFR
jgi:hypothetical protein